MVSGVKCLRVSGNACVFGMHNAYVDWITDARKDWKIFDKYFLYLFQMLLQILFEYCKITTYSIYNNICLQ